MKTKSLHNSFLSLKEKIAGRMLFLKLLISTQIMMMPVTAAYAAGEGDTNKSGGNEVMNVIVKLIDIFIDFFPAIGIVIVVVGVYKLFMAFRNDQPDAYSGAAKDIAIGVVMIVFKVFVWNSISATLIGSSSATS